MSPTIAQTTMKAFIGIVFVSGLFGPYLISIVIGMVAGSVFLLRK